MLPRITSSTNSPDILILLRAPLIAKEANSGALSLESFEFMRVNGVRLAATINTGLGRVNCLLVPNFRRF